MPGIIATVTLLIISIFILLSVGSHTRIPWLDWIAAAAAVAIALGWFATRVRRGSILTIQIGTLTFLLGFLAPVVWLCWAGSDIDAVMTALTLMILTLSLAASSYWALYLARRLHSHFPHRLARPHATRRLSVPRDARVLRAFGPALWGSMFVFAALATVLALGPLLRQGAIAVGIRLFIPGALTHFRRVRAVLALRAHEVRLGDRRLPVLLLRSFSDDDLLLKRTKALLTNVAMTKLSLEEQIVAYLWEIGPVIAFGQPTLQIDPIGAAREHVLGPLWQPRVEALIEESATIVVVLGKTEGLIWEYEQLAQRDASFLVILPPNDGTVLTDRWQRFAAVYPPARNIILEGTSEFPLLIWFQANHEPLVVSGQSRDERSYELALLLWSHNRILVEAPVST